MHDIDRCISFFLLNVFITCHFKNSISFFFPSFILRREVLNNINLKKEMPSLWGIGHL